MEARFLYTPRYDQDRIYLNLFRRHWSAYYHRHEMEIEEYQKKVVERFILCGDPKEGFALVECPDCKESYFVPFSCKTRICNSCGEKHVLEWSDWLTHEVLLNVNHRHMVWTLPRELDDCFKGRPWLMKQLLQITCNIADYLFSVDGKVGIVAVLQTYGDRINLNVHIHMLMAECQIKDGFWSKGLSLQEGCEEGLVLSVPRINFKHLNVSWRNRVLNLLVNADRLTSDQAEELKIKYPHGFVVYQTEKQTNDNEEEARTIAAYLMKPPVHEKKIEQYDKEEDSVLIRFKYGVDGCCKNIYKYESMSVDEFISRTIQHILPFHLQRVRYYGFYSNKHRGKYHRKQQKDSKPRKAYNMGWRKLLWRIFHVEPLKCLNCGAEMKITGIFTGVRAREILKDYTAFKYYIKGRWREDLRQNPGSPPGGIERRRAA